MSFILFEWIAVYVNNSIIWDNTIMEEKTIILLLMIGVQSSQILFLGIDICKKIRKIFIDLHCTTLKAMKLSMQVVAKMR